MSVVGLRLTCVRVRHFSPPEAGAQWSIGVEVVYAIYAKVLRIRATGYYVEDAESVPSVRIELLEAEKWKFFISIITAIGLSDITF